MALKSYNNTGKKKKTSIEENAEALKREEIERRDSGKKGITYKSMNNILKEKALDNTIAKISIESLYAAPYNKEWNSFAKISTDKEFELDRSIVDVGLLSPIVVWKINKEEIEHIYKEDQNNPYTFVGDEYMVLAGHSRGGSYQRLYEATNDERYLYIDAVIKEDISFSEAKYIIKITNFANRELSNKEKRESVNFMYRLLDNDGYRGHEIAKKIADDSGKKLRTVQYYIKINNGIIEEFGDMLDNEEITQTSAYKLSALTKDLQKWFYATYKDDITDNLLKGLKPSYDRKEQLKSLFKTKNYGENITVSIDVPKDLEKKFRVMASKWINKQINK